MYIVRTLFRFPSKLRRRARRSRITLMLLLLLLFFVLTAPLYAIYKPPQLLIRYFQYRWPDVLWQSNTTQKVVALTIDDAPSEHTSEILQLLKANDATATFFAIGSQIPGKEAVLTELIRNGNELGNHALKDEPSRDLPDTVLVQQIESVRMSIQEAYATANRRPPPNYFRPGSGFFSTKMRAVLKTLDYKLVLGSVFPHDPQIPYSWINARHILSMVRPGAIIICHDRRSWTAPMLRKVLPELKREGYRVVTVTELLTMSTTWNHAT